MWKIERNINQLELRQRKQFVRQNLKCFEGFYQVLRIKNEERQIYKLAKKRKTRDLDH